MERYLLDPERHAELERLLQQSRLITQGMGGLFPERGENLDGIRAVLDVGCGPGVWAMEVAQAFPGVKVTGIDVSRRMITYAQGWAQELGQGTIRFQVMDATKPLGFPDGSFDLVNGRSMVSFLPRASWATVLKEFVRILRPRGTIRITDGEIPYTNGEACERLIGIHMRALKGRSFSPDGRTIGLMPHLGPLLSQAGCQNIQYKGVLNVLVPQSPLFEVLVEDLQTLFAGLRPFLLASQVTTGEEYERLLEKTGEEMRHPDFCVVGLLLTAWGQTPC